MPTYIVFGQFTEQGIRNVKDTSKRADAAKELAKKFGAKVLDLYWTIGRYDSAFIVEAPDDETITAFALSSARSAMFGPRPCVPSRKPRSLRF
jgi:uncharacterized protein with GYD domain